MDGVRNEAANALDHAEGELGFYNIIKIETSYAKKPNRLIKL